MGRGPAKDKAIALAPATTAHGNNELDDLMRKRDAFVTSMTMLRNAAEEASRAGLAYFDHIIGTAPNGDHTYAFQRGMSVVPAARAITEEPDGAAGMKRTRRKREKRDPDLPKRPMTAYLLFCHNGRELVKKDLGENATHKDVIAELTRRWAEVPEEEKKAWQDIYQENRAVYDRELAEYKASKDPHSAIAVSTSSVPLANTAAPAAPAGGFTAVNHTETASHSDPESEAEPEHVLAAPAAVKAAEPEPEAEAESELSEAEEEEEDEVPGEVEEEEEEEEEKSPSPPPKSPTPPPKSKATPRGKKAAANGTKKTTVQAPASPPREKEKRKRTSSRKKAAEEEAVVAEESPKKRGKKRRKSSAD